jgi:N-acetylglucosaminyldiphosphoundecaprenol N-acetyl-beta-D-mannosaminyltransferase
LDIPIDILAIQEFEKLIITHIRTSSKGWICYINIHTMNMASQYGWYKNFIEDSVIRYCDGEGVRFGAFLSGINIPERITLTTYIYDLAALAVKYNIRLFFLGGLPDVIQIAAKKITSLYPELQLVGYHHGYFTKEQTGDILQMIHDAKPDILLVGMGVPLQEKWVKENYNQLDIPLIWVGGGFLDFLSGAKKKCPNWLSKIGLEWLFRLVQEPKRLWKRYLIGIPMFFLHIILRRLRKR